MSYLLCMDESGHDHKNTPYEVRGGIALRVDKLWPFVQAMRKLEIHAFGDTLSKYGKEIKGHKLLDKDRFKWAYQDDWMEDEERRKSCLAFLNRGIKKEAPKRHEFTAFGQACLTMVREMFSLLKAHEAVVFAGVIPSTVKRPADFVYDDYLRKDHVYVFQRYYDFLEEMETDGLLIMDETEKEEDRRFVNRMYRYFERTQTGNLRASRIAPVPFFVSSDMSYPVQAADCVIYCINWGFRLPKHGMDFPTRQDVADESADWIARLQACIRKTESGQTYREWGIKFVPDPYTSAKNEKGGKSDG